MTDDAVKTRAFPMEKVARLCLTHMFGQHYQGESLCDEAGRVFSQPNPRAVKAVNLAHDIELLLATTEAASGAGEREDEHGDIVTIAYMMGAKAECDRFASLPPATDPAVRLRIFLEILLASGGEADAGDSQWNWINAFCEDHEKRSPDTFNTAADRGFTATWYDGDRDHGSVRITHAGRSYLAALAAAPTIPVTEVPA